MNQPFVVAYGMGVDSTAMLIGLSGIGMRPDLILFADVGGEKDETLEPRPVKKLTEVFLCASQIPNRK